MGHRAEAVQLRVEVAYQVAGNHVGMNEHTGSPRHGAWRACSFRPSGGRRALQGRRVAVAALGDRQKPAEVV
ncbi:hypothetical protein D3C76_1650050 [compost metagenome]